MHWDLREVRFRMLPAGCCRRHRRRLVFHSRTCVKNGDGGDGGGGEEANVLPNPSLAAQRMSRT